jgi:hypothetical protein
MPPAEPVSSKRIAADRASMASCSASDVKAVSVVGVSDGGEPVGLLNERVNFDVLCGEEVRLVESESQLFLVRGQLPTPTALSHATGGERDVRVQTETKMDAVPPSSIHGLGDAQMIGLVQELKQEVCKLHVMMAERQREKQDQIQKLTEENRRMREQLTSERANVATLS